MCAERASRSGWEGDRLLVPWNAVEGKGAKKNDCMKSTNEWTDDKSRNGNTLNASLSQDCNGHRREVTTHCIP